MLVNQKLFIIELLISKSEPSLNCSHGILSFCTQAVVTTVPSVVKLFALPGDVHTCFGGKSSRAEDGWHWGKLFIAKILRKMNNDNVKYSEATETK